MGSSQKITKSHPAQGTQGLSGDVLEIRRIFSRAGESRIEVALQPRGRTERYFGRMDLVDEANRRYEIRFAPADLAAIEQAARKSGSNEVLIVLFVKGKYLVCIRSNWTGKNEGRLQFAYPDRIYKLQRRKDIRYIISSAYEISVTLPVPLGETPEKNHGKKITRPLVDISASGLAFRVDTEEELARFPKGEVLEKASLVLRGRKITFDAVIRNHIPMLGEDDAPQFKVGLEFNRINKDDLDLIEYFVLIQTAQSAI